MNLNNLSRSEIIYARIECDKSLLFFVKFWFRVLKNQKFIVNWHHEEICKELDNIENYKLELLNINIPPRFSKTEIAAVNFIARGIGMNPNSNWLYITASDELRSQVSVSIRDIVTHPYFRLMYGIELKKDQNSKNLWRTEQGGGLKTATIFGQITGFGAGQISEDCLDQIRYFEGAIVLDDLNKTDDSQEENAINEKVSRTVFNTVLSRKNSRDTPIINIQQRAGFSDVTAQFMEHFVNDERAKFMIYPIENENQTPLWEAKFNKEDILKLKNSPKTAHVFDTQYMQIARRREGLLFQKGDFYYYDQIPKQFEAIHAYVDIADTGSDSHCVVVVGLFEAKWYVIDVLFTKENVENNVELTAEILNKHKPRYCRIETNMGGSMYVKLLRPLAKETTLLQVKNQTNKVTRVINNRDFVLQNFLFPTTKTKEFEAFENEIYTFQKDGKHKHDDAIDTLTGLAESIFGFFSNLYK